MTPKSELDKIRRDFEARQQSLVPGDKRKISIAAQCSPWNQTRVERSLIPALLFLLLSIGIVAIPFIKNFEDGTIVAFVIAIGPLFVFWLLIRNYVLHRGQRTQDRNN